MTNYSELVFEQRYGIRSYELLTDQSVFIAAICNQLQDIASAHADSLGFGYADLEQSGHFWVLARLHIMTDRLPGYGTTLSIHTWPSANERLTAMRDFLIHDDKGPMGRATTSWVTLNKETHRADPPDTVLDGRFIPERDRALTFPTKAVPRLKAGDYDVSLTARRSDMDINDHVNNVKYVEFCLEAVPQDWFAAKRCMGLDIQFRTESRAGDEYVAACSQTDDDNDHNTMLHSLTRTSDNKEIVRMRSWWTTR